MAARPGHPPRPGTTTAPLKSQYTEAMRFFNTTGPIAAEQHYHVPPLARLDEDELLGLIAQWRYFVLHAPRQTGKTTALEALQERLNGSGRYRCAYLDVSPASTAHEDVAAAMQAILDSLALEVEGTLPDSGFPTDWAEILRSAGPRHALRRVLAEWTAADPRPLILFIDELDTLVGDTLLSVLRQLRAGYRERPRRFAQSVILCGVRNVRDYRIHAASEKGPVLGGSAFNIKAESLRLGDFSEVEVRSLLLQHTAETGQAFSEAALAELWRLSRGQPWLVNALAAELCFAKAGLRDRSREVTLEAVVQARERLIQRRDTHLDQLAAILEESRVRRVVEPLLSGEESDEPLDLEALRYVRDLGLVAQTDPVRVANPIYREVIPRELTYATQAMLSHEWVWYVGGDGRLRMDKLMGAFQAYFREHSEHWLEGFQYREAGPQLLLHAFVHRVVNSGGRLEREYGVGRRRMDLAVIWPVRPGGADTAAAGEQRIVVECKVVRRGRGLDTTLREGLEQTAAYMELWGAEAGHLALFDRRGERSWEARLYRREEPFEDRTITVWGM